jgi:hypothetical protein
MATHTDTAPLDAAARRSDPAGRAGPRRRARLLSRAAALLFALFLAGHGLAHIVGILEIFGLKGEASNTSTLAADLGAGSAAYQALGAVWVIAMVLFVAAAAGIVLRKRWWLPVAFAAALVSLVVCTVWYEAAVVGFVVNLILLAGLSVYAVVSRRVAR